LTNGQTAALCVSSYLPFVTSVGTLLLLTAPTMDQFLSVPVTVHSDRSHMTSHTVGPCHNRRDRCTEVRGRRVDTARESTLKFSESRLVLGAVRRAERLVRYGWLLRAALGHRMCPEIRGHQRGHENELAMALGEAGCETRGEQAAPRVAKHAYCLNSKAATRSLSSTTAYII
jgi:hypothetical protein